MSPQYEAAMVFYPSTDAFLSEFFVALEQPFKKDIDQLFVIELCVFINMFVWIDCEMTGLNIQTDFIIEIACLITNHDLDIIALGPELIINQPLSVMNNMNEWCTEHHGNVF